MAEEPEDRDLGLAVSWQIMRRLGGTLELMPDRRGGACFLCACEVGA